MSELVVAHTGQLDEAALGAARDLLADVFAGRWTDEDWEHCLGGMHALVWEGPLLVGHASLVQRRLMHARRALRAGYVEGVGVRSEHRRRGHAAAIMAALEHIARGAYEVGALSASDEAAGFYAGRGWRRWQGPTSALTPAGVVRTPAEDDGVHVLALSAQLDLRAELTCDCRDGDPW